MSACAVTAPPAPGQARDPAAAPAPPRPGAGEAAPAAEAGKPAGPETASDAALVAAPETAPEADPLPNVALSADLLYRLTKAELEFKNGNWQGPYVTMLAAAQHTRDPRLARRAMEMALAAKQGGEAMAAVRLWRALAPKSDEATQYFLGFVVLSEQMEEAEPIFARRLREAAPAARPLAMFQMYQFMSRAKDRARALALLERVLAPYGADLESHLVLAQALGAMGEGARAVQQARQALALKPDSELAVLTLAQVSGAEVDSGAILTEFLERNPGAREVRAAYARLLIEQKQYAPARVQYQLLLKSQPDNLNTLYALGILSMQLNEVAVAETWFKQFLTVVAAKPGEQVDSAKVLLILSQIAEERGDIAAALAWIDRIDGPDPRVTFNARLKRAQLMARHGQLDAARTTLAQLQGGDAGEQARLLQTDAQILRDGGYDQSAYTVLENGLKRFPKQPELLYDLALAAEKLGKLDVMEASLRQVIAQAPDNHQAYNALGYALAERNVRLPEAYTLIETALKLAPDDPFIMDSMGWVQFRLGRLAEAEALLRQAYNLRKDPEIAVHLGEVLWQQGEQDKARSLWREARAKDPKNDALKSTLARLNLSL
ncbi:MAG: tetratricopeptide repeat protein [Pseudomonadota bacterium]